MPNKAKHESPAPKRPVHFCKSFHLGSKSPVGNVWYADKEGFSALTVAMYELGVSGVKIVSVDLEQRQDGAYVVVTHE